LPASSDQPALSVVVMGYRNRDTIVGAVGSILAQADDRVEVVVVTSGGDDSATLVRTAFPGLGVVEIPGRLMPGGARNAGIAASRGAVVAFLAGDCVAAEGWVGGRLARHAEGHPVVASAVVNADRRRPAAWGFHFGLYSHRLAGRPAGPIGGRDGAAHGCSFDRAVLERAGGFSSDMRVGEDTQMGWTLDELGVPVWFEPTVQTAHRGPPGMVELVRDDVEDGLALAQPILESYCPAATRPAAEFALRHHDYVKDSFLGEAPVAALIDDLETLDPEQRPVALAALGLIQVAGASSLGVGRLTDFRIAIFHACLDGTALADPSPELRLARLLAPSPDPSPAAGGGCDVAAARAARDGLPAAEGDDLDVLLASVFVHGWHGFVADIGPDDRLGVLVRLAGHNRAWGADHLVLADSVRSGGRGRLADPPRAERYVALSGTQTVTIVA